MTICVVFDKLSWFLTICSSSVCCLSMIGHYVRHIKSRKHPENNIMRRMLWERSVEMQRIITSGRIDQQLPADDEDNGVAPSCTHSAVATDKVFWPALTKNNSQIVHGGKPPAPRCKSNHSCCVALLNKYLGAHFVKAEGLTAAIGLKVLRTDSIKLAVGAWRYATFVREEKNKRMKTTQAWFAISARHVPIFADKCRELFGDDEQRLNVAFSMVFYGRFRAFLRLTTTAGHKHLDLSLAECDIYRPISTHPLTRLATLSTEEEAHNYLGTHINVCHILCPIARGSVFDNWQKFKHDPKNEQPVLVPDHWVCMHIHK